MADRRGDLTVARNGKRAEGGGVDRTPAYASITERLRRGIESGSLPEGAVLLEGPLASIFGSSRSPVKQALARLEEEGLLSRFDGRGLLVGTAGEPIRLKITAEMFDMDAAAMPATKHFAWQSLYYDFEREVILRSVFGRFRVNELALARHFNVGRTVARDLLIYAQQVGIVAKGEKSHWWIVPLDEARFQDLYDLRMLLEPAALETAVGAIPTTVLSAMAGRLEDGINRAGDAGIAELDVLEEELHIGCLSYGRNPEIVEALKRTRCILVSGKHFQVALQRQPFFDSFMEEHLEILQAIGRQDVNGAKHLLRAHLEASSEKAAERLAAFRATHQVSPTSYFV
ncbi:GntR family transcriptional regulator [Kaistia defluvii]|uniref:GntR family transcriptional regulator n=1 Tax=Kaistia defluvii TaxID=410841 RepID=UPI00225A9604|nr:GntR family transcriptional regulator [Kaistia defluvii]MCX5518274.1 GntR family transcriptional regulator [Kaistia defluvii]